MPKAQETMGATPVTSEGLGSQAKTKRSSPVPSPEFAAARALRDLRHLDERAESLAATYKEKCEDIETRRAEIRAALTEEGRILLSRMMKATEATSPNGGGA